MPPVETTFLGPFAIDADGLLRPADADHVPRFTIRWRGRPVQVQLRDRAGDLGALEFAATVGRVPSTAGRSAKGSRDAAFELVSSIGRLVPGNTRFLLGADHSVSIAGVSAIGLPASVFAVIGEVTRFLVTLQPYLDVLDEAGMGFAAGTANT